MKEPEIRHIGHVIANGDIYLLELGPPGVTRGIFDTSLSSARIYSQKYRAQKIVDEQLGGLGCYRVEPVGVDSRGNRRIIKEEAQT